MPPPRRIGAGDPSLFAHHWGKFTMKKLLRNVLLASLFSASAIGVMSLSNPEAFAQGAKGKAADKAKGEKPSAKGSVIIKPDAKERFRISIKNEDGKTLLMSAGNGFATEEEAKAAIEEIKAILETAKVTVEKGGDK
jgi:uncharacterized protein YegP (UPF0339 family)